MQAQIKVAFEEQGFIVVDTSFANLQLEEPVKGVVAQQRNLDPCAGLLYYFPGLFIYPRRIDPEKGCFFAITLSEGEKLGPDQKRILEKHFPVDKIAIFTTSNGAINCRWYKEPATKHSSLDSFTRRLA